ncbi:histidine phosphatase family protein [Anderseniella sp. Alg231-50]|uniref:histidine phosphatase family protein n=1 Tax=Anderseniella sp. Alg231-50 TaxID=1922226 RepID=UPI000D553900
MGLVLLRHTKPDIADGTCYGSTDLKPGANFAMEAEAVLQALPWKADQILSSPLVRCAQLADRISTSHSTQPSFHDGLKEMDFGVWEGLRWDNVPIDELNQWANDLLHARPHGGESVHQMQQRALAVLEAHGAWRADTATLVVTHAGVIRAVLDHAGVRDAWVTQTPYGGGWMLSADKSVTALG